MNESRDISQTFLMFEVQADRQQLFSVNVWPYLYDHDIKILFECEIGLR